MRRSEPVDTCRSTRPNEPHRRAARSCSEAPFRFPSANADRIAYLNARTFESFEDAQSFQLLLQILDPFLVAQIGHRYQAFDAFTGHAKAARRDFLNVEGSRGVGLG